MITIYRTIYGPYIVPTEDDQVVAVMQTSEGDMEIFFDSFQEFYETDTELPHDYDDDEFEDMPEEALPGWEYYVDEH